MNNVELLKQKYVQAEQLYNNNDYEKAITLYKEIIADNTLNDPCTNFEDSTVLYNINISSCHRLAYSYIFLVKHEEALKYFYIIEKEYPDFESLMKEFRDGILLFKVEAMEVWDKMKLPHDLCL